MNTIMVALLVVKKKYFSLLGTKVHFHVNSLNDFLLYGQPTFHVVANQEVLTLQSLCRVVANQTMSGHGDEVRPS